MAQKTQRQNYSYAENSFEQHSFATKKITNDIIVVSDFFVSDLVGGAELTTDALLTELKKHHSVTEVRSNTITQDFILQNQSKFWIFCNISQINLNLLSLIVQIIDYATIEYDYKYCSFRSEVLHKKQTGHECDCPLRPNGMLVEKLYDKALKVFWMSEQQKEHFLSRVPSLIFGDDDKHVIQGSTFTEKSINDILKLKEQRDKVKQLPFKIYGIQASNNWIKGTEETVKYCNSKKYPVKVIQNMSYDKFLVELSKYGMAGITLGTLGVLLYVIRDNNSSNRSTSKETLEFIQKKSAEMMVHATETNNANAKALKEIQGGYMAAIKEITANNNTLVTNHLAHAETTNQMMIKTHEEQTESNRSLQKVNEKLITILEIQSRVSRKPSTSIRKSDIL